MIYDSHMDGKPRYTARQLGPVMAAQGRKKRWLAAQVGVHESLIGKLIAGQRSASQQTAERISAVLGLPIGVLFAIHERSEIIIDVKEKAA
jgi:plasmid maintenance system antidote protein VapI